MESGQDQAESCKVDAATATQKMYGCEAPILPTVATFLGALFAS